MEVKYILKPVEM
uniref:Uncharacterized protein n=1 Tax=Rhizophora mucronata TaxID=61149 RepID=A0A2P2IIH0_RHIMU